MDAVWWLVAVALVLLVALLLFVVYSAYFQLRWVVVLVAKAIPSTRFFFSTAPTNVVALTIDDAPTQATDSILDILCEFNAHATFFVIGHDAEGRQATLQRMVREGHEVGNHTFRDEPSFKMSPEAFAQSVRKVLLCPRLTPRRTRSSPRSSEKEQRAGSAPEAAFLARGCGPSSTSSATALFLARRTPSTRTSPARRTTCSFSSGASPRETSSSCTTERTTSSSCAVSSSGRRRRGFVWFLLVKQHENSAHKLSSCDAFEIVLWNSSEISKMMRFKD